MGREAEGQKVPQTPDQEAFLKEHFVTLADLSNSGTSQNQFNGPGPGPGSLLDL